MDEAKRRKLEQVVKTITDNAADEGKIIELGWLLLRVQAIPKDAPQIQLDEMHQAFFAGAQHLFSSIMTMLDPNSEPTERDLRRMNSIDKELQSFIADYSAKHMPTRGSA
jgi:hypothetical protein